MQAKPSKTGARSAPEPGRPAQPGLRGHHGAQRRRVHVAHRLHLLRVGLHCHVRACEQDVVHLPNQRRWLAARPHWQEPHSMLQSTCTPPQPPFPAPCPARSAAATERQLCKALRRCSPKRRPALILDVLSCGRLCQPAAPQQSLPISIIIDCVHPAATSYLGKQDLP